ncbi:hypothetical protein LTR10_015988 [Elasticomyces elasticus]|uniref:Uncharacterized protein n=1 Tax=Exophiala sideris TaxID=1016849 RepID=A0ABR0J2B9_9EURO|nr:hypothetical protein LTR10_015988 [Elasticomyces elasticus]KAK5024674.1 hypothetical protein LTS07_008520 [Exophiala sideris]KAK5030767.1 hypothetical protein LTR13_008121 [Exophiala sideris]KAK5054308.1 hypothetical protein LTR69_008923 [Exophiala sideris]KAK5179710.1 hypothetical protein LTR44_007878 [Eurotiomycetes sp. CCFEE 6388]
MDSDRSPTSTRVDRGPTAMPLDTRLCLADPVMNFDDLSDIPLIDYFQEVMTPGPETADIRANDLEISQFLSRDVLDFTLDSALDMSAFPMAAFLPSGTPSQSAFVPVEENPSRNKSGIASPGNGLQGVSLGQQAFNDSIWL